MNFLRKLTVYLINGTLGKIGLQMRRLPREIAEEPLPPVPDFDPTPHIWLSSRGIKTVLDIGGNTGQFAKYIREILPLPEIISFEPLRDCYEQLVKNGEEIKRFRAYNFGLGSKNEKVEMHRSEFSPSSSILPMGQLHKDIFPFTKQTYIEEIEVKRLDDIKGLKIQKPLLVKIDVQGFEDQVIDGGKKTISMADVVIAEVSFDSLYDAQPLFDDIYKRLRKLGFVFHGFSFQDIDPRDGAVIQGDGIFIKEKG